MVVIEPAKEATPMFLADCNQCGRRELRSVHAITRLTNTTGGIEIGFRCSACGARQHTRTGAQSSRALPLAS